MAISYSASQLAWFQEQYFSEELTGSKTMEYQSKKPYQEEFVPIHLDEHAFILEIQTKLLQAEMELKAKNYSLFKQEATTPIKQKRILNT